MTKKKSAKFVNFMTPWAWVLVPRRGNMMLNFIKNLLSYRT